MGGALAASAARHVALDVLALHGIQFIVQIGAHKPLR
jgi:hypothetical protein